MQEEKKVRRETKKLDLRKTVIRIIHIQIYWKFSLWKIPIPKEFFLLGKLNGAHMSPLDVVIFYMLIMFRNYYVLIFSGLLNRNICISLIRKSYHRNQSPITKKIQLMICYLQTSKYCTQCGSYVKMFVIYQAGHVFFIKLWENVLINRSVVGYLDCLDAPTCLP